MNNTPISQDPLDEATNSAVFVPLDAALVRKLVSADQNIQHSPVFSEPSDDESERRYSDVSIHTDEKPPTCPSLDTVELIHQWNLRRRDNISQQDSPPATQRRVPEPEPATHPCYHQPTLSSSTGLSPTAARRWEETLPSGGRPLEERKRQGGTSNFEPKRYEFYGVGQENTPGYYSTPYFSVRPSKPDPIRPVAPPEPQKKKMSSWWKFLSGKRRPKRERRTEDLTCGQPFQCNTEPVKEKRDWKVDSFRRLRRSGRHPTNIEEAFTNKHSNSGRRRSAGMEPRSHRRARTLVRAPESPIAIDQHSSPVRLLNNDSPSLGVLPASTFYGNGERLGSYLDSKKEASSFSALRGRVMFMTEGSSVSSLSDREDDSNIESSHLYLSRRQLRAMQYK